MYPRSFKPPHTVRGMRERNHKRVSTVVGLTPAGRVPPIRIGTARTVLLFAKFLGQLI